MCLSPITICNPTKYVSIHYKDRFLLQVPCGSCAECQRNKSSEWLYRTYYEFIDTHEKGGFVLFDTLTYDNDHLPLLSQFEPGLPSLPCFKSQDLVNFLKLFRIRLKRKYHLDKCVSYFISSEYGSKYQRPHYHMLLFVKTPHISPIVISRLVAQCWSKGRTDGVPYKSAGYVYMHNTIRNASIGEMLRCANYVTKYVQKDCEFSQLINDRIKVVKLSVKHQRRCEHIINEIKQFHLQSLHYGERALMDLDLNQLADDGYLLMPSFNTVKSKISIPMYYLRKLYYQLDYIDGTKFWALNSDGMVYKSIRHDKNIILLASRFSCAAMLINLKIDAMDLARYVLDERGRYRADIPSVSINERLENITHFPYVTRSDKEVVGCGISSNFIGNSVIGYEPLVNFTKISDFIAQYVYLDSDKEAILTKLYKVLHPINQGQQDAFALTQRLTKIFKSIG